MNEYFLRSVTSTISCF